MKGLIASVLGGVSRGVGEVAAGQIELNSRKALMEAEEEMRARLAEAAEGRAETRQIAAEERAIKNIGREAQAEEDILARRYGEGSKYPGLISQQISAQETPGQKAAREREELLAADEQTKRDVLQSLLTTPESDPAYQGLLRQWQVMSGASGSRMDPQQSAQIDYYQSRINQLQRSRQDAIRDFGPDDPSVSEIDTELGWAQSEISKLLGLPSFSRSPVTIRTQEEYDRLPSGAQFFEDGKLYSKP